MSVILVTGAKGQVGWELNRTLLPLGRVVAFDRAGLDLTDTVAVTRLVRDLKPAIIVNAAAYTAVDQAEQEIDRATAINARAPGILAEEALRLGALLVHYSTEYVFDGTKDAPYSEQDVPNPQSVYGRSKLDGERAIQASGADHLILRTSWVYAARGSNFLRTILRLAAEREELRVVMDQIGAPTWARLIAEVTASVMSGTKRERRSGNFESGVFNLAAAGQTSWHGFAEAIVARERRRHPNSLRVQRIVPIPSSEYPQPARRPRNSRLNCDKLRGRFDVTLPPWEAGLELCLDERVTAS